MSDKTHTQALERFKLGAESMQQQRVREKAALEFQVPELQWTKEARDSRNGDSALGIPPRPMLSIPKIDQPVQLVLNQEKAATLGVQIHPVSEDADQDTAEMLQDHYRQIEVDSRAWLARSWAFERGVKCGWGAYRLLTEFDPSAPPGSRDQRILLKRILHQESVYLDPFSQEPNYADARWGFIVQWVPFSRYKADAPEGDEIAAFDDSEFTALAIESPEWAKGDKESRAVLIAEYFCIHEENGVKKVYWRKMNGVGWMSKEQPVPGSALPIFVYVGRELIPFDAERRFVGMIEPNMDGQRFFNVAATTTAETMLQEPRNTWILAEGQDAGFEREFDEAHIRPRSRVHYKPVTHNGELAPVPRREQADTSKLSLSIQALSTASEFIHAGTFAFEPSLGQNSPNVKTKGATLALQAQGDQANSHWLQSLVDTMTHEASVVLDWIAFYYQRPGRVIRTRDGEGNQDRVMLNQPFYRQQGKLVPVDPQQPPQGITPDQIEHYNLASGARYGVTVSIGKGYKSRVEQGTDMLGQLLQAEPELMKVAGDIYFRFADFPGHMELSERFKKLLPPQLQDKGGDGDPAMELQQAKAALQQVQQESQQMADAIKTDQVKVQGQVTIAKIKASADLQKEVMANATKIAVARITAAKASLDSMREGQEEALALNQQISADAEAGSHDRAHEMALAAMEHEHAMQAAQQDHDHAVEQAEQGAQIAGAQSAQDHGEALDAGQQATAGQLAVQAAQPQPTAESGA